MSQVAKLLDVNRATVYRLIAEGRLGHVRVSNAVRVHVEHLKAYVRTWHAPTE